MPHPLQHGDAAPVAARGPRVSVGASAECGAGGGHVGGHAEARERRRGTARGDCPAGVMHRND